MEMRIPNAFHSSHLMSTRFMRGSSMKPHGWVKLVLASSYSGALTGI